MRLILIPLLVMLFASPLLGDGVPCRYRQLISSYESGDVVQQAWADGSALFLASWEGLEILDTSDPAALERIGFWQGGRVDHFEVDGDLAYLVGGGSLRILDISDRSAPALIGELTDAFVSSPSIARDGSLLYVNASTDIAVVDITDVTQPTIVARVDHPSGLGTCERMIVDSGVLYGAWSGYGVVVFDVSDPSNATQIDQVELIWGGRDALLIDDVLYVTSMQTGLLTYDTSDPSELTLIRSVGTSSAFTEMSLDGSTLAVAGYGEGVVRVDISDPSQPARTSSFQPTPFTLRVAQSGGVTYAIEGKLVSVMDLRQDLGDPVVTDLNFAGIITNGLHEFAVHESIMYVVDAEDGLVLIDVSDPLDPFVRARVETPSRLLDLHVEYPFVYASGVEDGRLYVFLVNDPDAPVLAWRIFSVADYGRVHVRGDRVYVADGRVHVFELPASLRPEHLFWFDTPDDANDIRVVGDLAYVACMGAGLQIYDLSDEQSPTLIGGYDTPDEAFELEVIDGIAYILDGSSVQIIDVSDPTSPSLIAAVEHPGLTWDIDLVGDRMYVSYGTEGTSVFDVSDLSAPELVGTHPARVGQRAVAVIGFDDMAYVLQRGIGVRVVDFSDCPPCPADFDGSGSLDFFDVSAFLALFNAQSSGADLNGDGVWDFFDISAFLQAYQAGC